MGTGRVRLGNLRRVKVIPLKQTIPHITDICPLYGDFLCKEIA